MHVRAIEDRDAREGVWLMSAEVLLTLEILEDHERRVRAAVLEEREACATAADVAESEMPSCEPAHYHGFHEARRLIAAAIRARK